MSQENETLISKIMNGKINNRRKNLIGTRARKHEQTAVNRNSLSIVDSMLRPPLVGSFGYIVAKPRGDD